MAAPKLTFIYRPGDRDMLQLSLFGLKALVDEMESQGVSLRALLSQTGVLSEQFDDIQR
jgi:hypothetical protein